MYEAVKIEKPISSDTCGAVATDGKTFLHVHTIDGAISIRSLQLAGKKRMSVEDFLRGYRLSGEYRVSI